jgi:hypothetical protein
MAGLYKNLNEEELVKANEWYSRLGQVDQKNLESLLGTLEKWMDGELKDEKRHMFMGGDHVGSFFTIYAVGSTITSKQNPADIDLLLVTDHFANECARAVELVDLIKSLSEKYEVSVDDKVSQRYDYESDARIKIDLSLKQDKSAKPVDLIYQYDILSEERWKYNDKFDSLVLFRTGDGEESNSHKCKVYRGSGRGGYDSLSMKVFRKNRDGSGSI